MADLKAWHIESIIILTVLRLSVLMIFDLSQTRARSRPKISSQQHTSLLAVTSAAKLAQPPPSIWMAAIIDYCLFLVMTFLAHGKNPLSLWWRWRLKEKMLFAISGMFENILSLIFTTPKDHQHPDFMVVMIIFFLSFTILRKCSSLKIFMAAVAVVLCST